MTKDEAITAHKAWKTRFRVAMAKREVLDVAQIASDSCCRFGQWLYSEASAKFGDLPEYMECVEVHAELHRECGRIAEALNAHGVMAAERMLGFDTPYAEISNRLGVAVVAMFRAAERG